MLLFIIPECRSVVVSTALDTNFQMSSAYNSRDAFCREAGSLVGAHELSVEEARKRHHGE